MRSAFQLFSSSLLLFVALYTSIGARAIDQSISVPGVAVLASGLETSDVLDDSHSPREFIRRKLVCPTPGGKFCSDKKHCCPQGTFCQLNNHHGPSCCPNTARNCNGGQTCCPSNSVCCSFKISPTGCCRK